MKPLIDQLHHADAWRLFRILDELSEVLVLIQTEKVHPFPVYALPRGYWQGVRNC